MENDNQNLPNPPVPPTATTAKKSPTHKGLMAIIILALVAGTAVWVYFILNPLQTHAPLCDGPDCPFAQNGQTNKSTSQYSTSTPVQTDISNWKIYKNNEYGFEFQYPDTWIDAGRSIDIEDYFITAPQVDVFDISVMKATGTLTEIANKDIAQNNCPGDHLIPTSYNGVMYSLNCSATSEDYNYIFINNQNQVIQLSYHDDFDESSPEASKIVTLNQIIATLSTLQSPDQSQSSAVNSTQSVINDKYDLFVETQVDSQYGDIPATQYQDDGIIASGQYTGYHRLVAGIEDDSGPGVSTDTYVFATQDYQTYIVDMAADGYNSPDNILNKNKVIGFGSIPLDSPPPTISLGNFILSLQNYSNSGDISGSINLSPSLGAKLPSSASSFTFYGDSDIGEYDNSTSTFASYLAGSTDVYAVDSSGLAYDYSFGAVEGGSNSFFDGSKINQNSLLYKYYEGLFPGGCGISQPYVLQNISESDLTQITTTVKGVVLYGLKDPNNPINQAEYAAKVGDYIGEFVDDNGVAVPSYQEYLAKHPVLIFQDPWGRWVGLGEYQYELPGGCGKPVIYLYPTKPTEVTVKFLNQMNFNIDIPTYAGQWDVLANPDGELKDLQPRVTDCGKINYSLVGSEYAQDACQKGIYPYLYWEGQTSGVYPKADTGWVVAKNNLSTFLNSKLAEIGLDEKEKSDMVGYWLPQLLSKDAPYYRLSFFQTQTMDKFIPMQVTPKPDTTIRVFLDWSPLTGLPSTPLKPEVLNHIDRKGFILVEWGGLKR